MKILQIFLQRTFSNVISWQSFNCCVFKIWCTVYAKATFFLGFQWLRRIRLKNCVICAFMKVIASIIKSLLRVSASGWGGNFSELYCSLRLLTTQSSPFLLFLHRYQVNIVVWWSGLSHVAAGENELHTSNCGEYWTNGSICCALTSIAKFAQRLHFLWDVSCQWLTDVKACPFLEATGCLWRPTLWLADSMKTLPTFS